MEVKEVKIEQMYDGSWIAFKGSNQAVTQLFEQSSTIISKGKKATLKIEQKKNGRSLNANAYMWVLLGKMAKVLGTSKEDLYRQYIEWYGLYILFSIEDEAVDYHMKDWESRGIGWFSSFLGSKNGMSEVISYYGSSTYKTDEMARVLEQVVIDAKELGIETMTPNELLELKENWR